MSAVFELTEHTLPPTLGSSTPEALSAYFLDLESLLSQIDSARTYYEVLGVNKEDDQEKIKAAFARLLKMLFPPYAIAKALPEETNDRIERAFGKASKAFGALANFARRRDYDAALESVGPKRRGTPQTGRDRREPVAVSHRDASVAPSEDEVVIRRVRSQGEVFSEYSRHKTDDNRRRVERFKLSIPARVTGFDRNKTKWSEMAETLDVSRTGLRLRMQRRVKQGTVLFVTLPLPAKLRSHGFVEQGYNVYTLVRRVEPSNQGGRVIGVEFLGEHPPAGFLDKPWATFRPKSWSGPDRRRPRREARDESVTLEYLDERLATVSSERVKTENVSRQGLRVAGTSAPAEIDLVMVRCPRLRFEALAAIRTRYVGKDGLQRLCMHLVDKEWPR